MPIYEIVDTNITLKDVFGNDLGVHPITAIEADNAEEALEKWHAVVRHDIDHEKVTVKEYQCPTE